MCQPCRRSRRTYRSDHNNGLNRLHHARNARIAEGGSRAGFPGYCPSADPETACIIEPPADPGTPFDGVEVEYIFAEHRLYEELMFFSPIELGYEDISCRLLLQELISEGDRYYDVLKIEVFARPVERAEMLSSARGTARRRRRPPVHTGEREFWFDITSFFGSDKLA